MEWSLTMVDPLVVGQWVLWLPTAVTLATLSMEGAPGLVRVMGLGVDQLQLVKVRNEVQGQRRQSLMGSSFNIELEVVRPFSVVILF